MVSRRIFRWTLALPALLMAGPAMASPLTLTGHVADDFRVGPGSGVVKIVDSPKPDGTSNPDHVAVSPYMQAHGILSGWTIQDLRLSYDKPSDTMSVGLHMFGIAGDADGYGDPAVASPWLLAAHGIKLPHIGGRGSITVFLDTNNDGKPDIVTGVPADKSTAGPGIDGFTLASVKPSNSGIANSYGHILTNNLGTLAFDPSAAHPDFEFTIKNFSKLPGLDPTKGFGIGAYSGSPDDVIAGEDYLALRHIALPLVRAETPEPTTLLAWSLVAAGAAWRVRRRKARA